MLVLRIKFNNTPIFERIRARQAIRFAEHMFAIQQA